MTVQRGRIRGLTSIAVACLLMPWQAYADDSLWKITALSGAVRFQTADEHGTQTWQPAAVGESLRSPFVVETGINGHAVLGDGNDEMTVNENSRVEISVDRKNRLTKALQSIGNLLYQVLPGKMRRFEVHTPYLVSVVKGTTFTIQVTEAYATVSLLEGLVDVFATDHMNKRHEEEIHPGEVAIFGRGKTEIQVLEPSSRVLEPSLPVEENLRRLNEALRDLDPVAVEMVKLPINTGGTDTGTVQADATTDVNAVEAESAAAAEQQRAIRDTMDRDAAINIKEDDKKADVDTVTDIDTRVSDDHIRKVKTDDRITKEDIPNDTTKTGTDDSVTKEDSLEDTANMVTDDHINTVNEETIKDGSVK